jgi:hypothetical protein
MLGFKIAELAGDIPPDAENDDYAVEVDGHKTKRVIAGAGDRGGV